MRITVSRKEFQHKLEQIKKIVPNKSRIQILECCLIVAEHGKAYLKATDFDTTMKLFINAEIIEEGAVCVNCKKIKDIVKQLKQESFTITKLDNERTAIEFGNTKLMIDSKDVNEYPIIKDLTNVEKIRIKKDEFLNAIKSVSHAMAKESHEIFNVLFLHLKNNKLYTMATDKHRLALAEVAIEGTKNGEKIIIIKSASVKNIEDYLERKEFKGVESIILEDGQEHAKLKIADNELIVKKIERICPQYEVLFDEVGDKILKVNREEFLQTLKYAFISVKNEEAEKVIKLDISSNKMVLTTPNMYQEININYTGEQVTFYFNIQYLIDAISTMVSDGIQMQFRDGLDKVLLTGEKTNNKYLIMPRRVA